MPLLLNIDTATEVASVCLTNNGVFIDLIKSENQKEHASFIHAAIARLLENNGYKLKDINAVAITSGPGSYTGLRVGMATAKGLCYALSIPLIAINTLEVMTKAAIETTEEKENILFCPMIDARRMEVFTAIYNFKLEEILSPEPIVLEKGLLNEYSRDKTILFFGNGSEKFRPLYSGSKGLFEKIQHDARHLGDLANVSFHEKKFANISYSEPTYFKEFHSITKTN